MVVRPLRIPPCMFHTTTNGPHDVPPTRPSLLFLDKCDWSGFFCSSTGGELRMGRAWDNSANYCERWVCSFQTAAAWSKLAAVPASSSGRSSNSGLGSTRARPAWSRSERNGTVQHAHFVHDASARLQLVVHASLRGATRRAWGNRTRRPNTQCMLTAAIGLTESVPFARGDRWRKRNVLIDRCRCSATPCVSWRDVLNDGY